MGLSSYYPVATWGPVLFLVPSLLSPPVHAAVPNTVSDALNDNPSLLSLVIERWRERTARDGPVEWTYDDATLSPRWHSDAFTAHDVDGTGSNFSRCPSPRRSNRKSSSQRHITTVWSRRLAVILRRYGRLLPTTQNVDGCSALCCMAVCRSKLLVAIAKAKLWHTATAMTRELRNSGVSWSFRSWRASVSGPFIQYNVYLVAFIVEQNVVGIRCSSDNMPVLMFC